jgi:hypothetical protein
MHVWNFSFSRQWMLGGHCKYWRVSSSGIWRRVVRCYITDYTASYPRRLYTLHNHRCENLKSYIVSTVFQILLSSDLETFIYGTWRYIILKFGTHVVGGCCHLLSYFFKAIYYKHIHNIVSSNGSFKNTIKNMFRVNHYGNKSADAEKFLYNL